MLKTRYTDLAILFKANLALFDLVFSKKDDTHNTAAFYIFLAIFTLDCVYGVLLKSLLASYFSCFFLPQMLRASSCFPTPLAVTLARFWLLLSSLISMIRKEVEQNRFTKSVCTGIFRLTANETSTS